MERSRRVNAASLLRRMEGVSLGPCHSQHLSQPTDQVSEIFQDVEGLPTISIRAL